MMQVELTEVDSSAQKSKILLGRLPVMIGQSPNAGIRVDDHLVSRHHCELSSVKGTLVVRDLGSMLGTFVNGLNVTTALLMPGDKLTVGITSYLVDYERRHMKPPVSSPRAETPPPEPEPQRTEEARLGLAGLLLLLVRRAFSPFRREKR
ncbi:MAG: FHA domain-containing protein [Planctomycetota bacterium]